MDSYNFTYKDVIKRHERMINRVEKWEIHALAIIMLVVTAFFTFSTFCFANDDEVVNYDIVTGITASPSRNYFTSNTNGSVAYIQVEQGYIYTITNNSNYEFYLYSCNDVPTLNGTYELVSQIPIGGSYSLRVVDDSYIYISTASLSPGWDFDRYLPMTRLKIGSMDGTVNDLVDNVGINQIWDIFGSGVDFVYVVVLVAFGIFLVAFAIRKISKGKSEI